AQRESGDDGFHEELHDRDRSIVSGLRLLPQSARSGCRGSQRAGSWRRGSLDAAGVILVEVGSVGPVKGTGVAIDPAPCGEAEPGERELSQDAECNPANDAERAAAR